MKTLFAELKDYDLCDLLRAYGVDIDRRNRVLAPWRDERTASVVVYDDHFYDYGDPDKHGDFLDWLELEGKSKEEARKVAARLIDFKPLGKAS